MPSFRFLGSRNIRDHSFLLPGWHCREFGGNFGTGEHLPKPPFWKPLCFEFLVQFYFRWWVHLRKRTPILLKRHLLGPALGRTDFSRIFIFEPPDFFADFLAGFFLLIFVGKSAQKNPSRKIPGKILQNLYNKNPPTHFCRLPRATSIPARRQSENAGPRLFGFIFDSAPISNIFSNSSSSALKRHLLKRHLTLSESCAPPILGPWGVKNQ